MTMSAVIVYASIIVTAGAINASSTVGTHCSARGSCDCDCGWAASGCGPDDGSCCYGCCCAAPPPSPPPGPGAWAPCSGGPCCNPHSAVPQYCPGGVLCQECGGSNACQCPLVPPPSPPPSPPTPPSPPSPTPPSPPGCATPVECHGALKKSGNQIVDKKGQRVKLNGLSMFWSNWAGSFWNGDVVKYLASQWKISLVRCAMGVSNDAGNVPGGYLDDPEGNKGKVSAVVDAAIEAGIYVLIDWHVEGRCNADQSKPFFSEMAQKYGQHPNIIWETCNEPHGWAWGAGLKSYHEQVIPIIREHSSNLIVAGTNTWSQDVDEASRDQLSDANVAYTLHFYSSMHKQWNRDKASTAMSNGAAIFVTEWGVEQNGEGNAETNIWLDFLRQHGISNSMWGIYDKDSEAWAIVHPGASPRGGWSQNELTNTGNFAKAYFLREAGGGDGPAPPSPSGTKTCAGRGGCACDCSWARPDLCHDDGSCCFACCCASYQQANQTFASILV